MPYGEHDLCACFADLVFFDMPYGILPLSWDVQMTQNEVTTMLKQVDAVQRKNNTMVCFMHTTEAANMVRQALRNRQFQDLQDWFWYKVGHFGTGPVSSYTNSIEMGTMAWSPSSRECHWRMDLDSRNRHNMFQIPSETLMVRDSEGNIVNPTQKPPLLLETICGHHVPPNGNILIVGAGAGGDVRGAINAGVNVVAVERDHKQFQILQTTLNKIHGQQVRQLIEDAKAVDAVATGKAAVPSVLNSQLSQDSTGTIAEGDEKEREGFPPCSQCAKEVEGGDPLFICYVCDGGTQMHPECGVTVRGKHLCLKHKAHPVDDE